MVNVVNLCTYLGYLCGECRSGKAVSALLNRCVSCEKISVLLIVALGKKQILSMCCIINFMLKHTYIFSHSWYHSDHSYSIMFTVTEAMAVPISILSTGTN